MKKLTAVLLSILLLCSMLCACTSGKKNGGDTPKEYEIGILSEDGWKSSWMGLQYMPGDSMRMANDQEFAEIAGNERANCVYEMVAVNRSNKNSVSVCVEHVSADQTVKQYLDTIKSEVRDADGASVKFSSAPSQDVGGIRFTRMDATFTYKYTYMDIVLKKTYLVAKKEDRMITLTFSCGNSGTIDAMLAGFSAYSG